MGEKNCEWTFAKMSENSYGFGFQEAMGENFKKVPYVSLVRESIQNSLDAYVDETPVEVSFSFTEVPKWWIVFYISLLLGKSKQRL